MPERERETTMPSPFPGMDPYLDIASIQSSFFSDNVELRISRSTNRQWEATAAPNLMLPA
jgi:hypothetical protein